MRANRVAGGVQRAEIGPVHIARLHASPAHSDEKSGGNASGGKKRRSKSKVGDVAVVEGDLGKEPTASTARLHEQFKVPLEEISRDNVRVVAAALAQLMVEKKEPRPLVCRFHRDGCIAHVRIQSLLVSTSWFRRAQTTGAKECKATQSVDHRRQRPAQGPTQ